MMKKILGLALAFHPINIKTRPTQLSPFNDQLADFREPPPPLAAEICQLITKKTSDVPLGISGVNFCPGIRYFRGQFLPGHKVFWGKFCSGIRILAIFDQKEWKKWPTC